MERIRNLDDAALMDFRRQTRIRHASTPEAREMLEKTIYETIRNLRHLGLALFNTQKLWTQCHAFHVRSAHAEQQTWSNLEPCPRVSGEIS
jgi:predicted  nucleic acid-binding Zn ribbon protein